MSQNPIPVPSANGATVIRWTCGVNVATFAITGLDSSEFNPSDSNGQGTSFTTTDSNNNATSYTYTVSAVHTNGLKSAHDPEIENGS